MIQESKLIFFMQKALLQAELAQKHGEVPVGAVIVDSSGEIVSRGYNGVERKGCQTEHAEVIAIRRACKKIGDWRLSGCWLYVTLEPCLMCVGLIALSRVAGVVYGARSPQFGFSLVQEGVIEKILEKTSVIAGVKQDESLKMLQAFFKKARSKGRAQGEAKN